jgi:nicotinamidase-related amidase
MLELNSATTALVLIDLQNGILAAERAPYASDMVLQQGTRLAEQFRAAGAPVVLVNVGWSPDYCDVLSSPVDQPMPRAAGGLPPGWSDLVDGLCKPGDLCITKRHWGAFWGTELDLQLRRRKIQTLVVAGVATNFGVESTVRQAWEHGYDVVVAEDACTSVSTPMHEFSMQHILPRIARVRMCADIALHAD